MNPKIQATIKKNLKKTLSSKEFLSTTGGTSIGAVVGSNIGIAAFGTAVSGTLPLALVCGAIGFCAAKGYRIMKKKN
jgi:hypothetical protein